MTATTQLDTTCPSWCTANHDHDPACWGPDNRIYLTLEDSYPHNAIPGCEPHFSPPEAGIYAYREQPGLQSVVYLHLYRPVDGYRYLDASVHLTADEAQELAVVLAAVARNLGGVGR